MWSPRASTILVNVSGAGQRFGDRLRQTNVKYAIRRLFRTPAFTVIAALSLALGIGANTAAFGVLYAVLLRPLPVRDPGSLAVVRQQHGATSYSMSYPGYVYLRDHATSTISDV